MSTPDDQATAIRTLIAQGIQKALGLHEPIAFGAAEIVYEEMRQHYASEKVYFPGRDPFRRQKVLADFNGRNHADVCRRHRISQRTLERYLAEGLEPDPAAAGARGVW